MAADPETGKAVVTGLFLVGATWITAQWAKRAAERKAETEAREHYTVAQLQAETADVAGLRGFVISMLGETEELRKEVDACRREHAACERKVSTLEAHVERLEYALERMRSESEKRRPS